MRTITDPTNHSLEAAFLDQKVADLFRYQQYAYVPVMNEHGKPWAIGIAVENENGYTPLVAETFRYATRDEAAEFCDGMNHHIGLTDHRACEIICSSMRSR